MLRLRPLRLTDEAAFHSAYQLMAAEGFTFGFDYEPTLEWTSYVKSLDDHRRAVNLPEGRVPDTFLVADVAGAIVGRTSIRHKLNERLEREGGHIGYCVLPKYRRRGYATEILHQSLSLTTTRPEKSRLGQIRQADADARATLCGQRYGKVVK
jgi:predicted acetyltransferase